MLDSILTSLTRHVEEDHKDKEYRPCVVLVVENPAGELLLVESAKQHGQWNFPQGGIDEHETVEMAIYRELQEETAVPRRDIKIVGYLGDDKLEIPTRKRDGFTKGKAYYFFHIHLKHSGRSSLIFPPDEIHDHKWVRKADVVGFLASTPTREKKRRSLQKALAKLH